MYIVLLTHETNSGTPIQLRRCLRMHRGLMNEMKRSYAFKALLADYLLCYITLDFSYKTVNIKNLIGYMSKLLMRHEKVKSSYQSVIWDEKDHPSCINDFTDHMMPFSLLPVEAETSFDWWHCTFVRYALLTGDLLYSYLSSNFFNP